MERAIGPFRTMPSSHAYIVIGVFATETSTMGIPLALLWKVDDPNEGVQIESLVAEGLGQQTNLLELAQQQWIEELLSSLPSVSSRGPEQVRALFERLSNLNVGPVRTIVRGSSSFSRRAGDDELFAAVLKRFFIAVSVLGVLS
jgi:hypothetical protein